MWKFRLYEYLTPLNSNQCKFLVWTQRSLLQVNVCRTARCRVYCSRKGEREVRHLGTNLNAPFILSTSSKTIWMILSGISIVATLKWVELNIGRSISMPTTISEVGVMHRWAQRITSVWTKVSKGAPGIEAVGGSQSADKNLVAIFPNYIFTAASNGVIHPQALDSLWRSFEALFGWRTNYSWWFLVSNDNR